MLNALVISIPYNHGQFGRQLNRLVYALTSSYINSYLLITSSSSLERPWNNNAFGSTSNSLSETTTWWTLMLHLAKRPTPVLGVFFCKNDVGNSWLGSVVAGPCRSLGRWWEALKPTFSFESPPWSNLRWWAWLWAGQWFCLFEHFLVLWFSLREYSSILLGYFHIFPFPFPSFIICFWSPFLPPTVVYNLCTW